MGKRKRNPEETPAANVDSTQARKSAHNDASTPIASANSARKSAPAPSMAVAKKKKNNNKKKPNKQNATAAKSPPVAAKDGGESSQPLEDPILLNDVPQHPADAGKVALDERIWFEEQALKLLRERKKMLEEELQSAQTEVERCDESIAELSDERARLKESRKKHLILQLKLHKSLAKSRARLKELREASESLEEAADEVDTSEADEESLKSLVEADLGVELDNLPISSDAASDHDGFGSALDDGTISVDKDDASMEQSGRQIQTWPSDSIFKGQGVFNVFPRELNTAGLLRYIPVLNSDALLSKVYDIAHDESEGCSAHCRRLHMANTVIDAIQLVRSEMPTGSQEAEDQKEMEETTVNPNIPFCPYELGGTCADPSCPYQHFDKQRETRPAEELKLPTMSWPCSTETVLETDDSSPLHPPAQKSARQTTVPETGTAFDQETDFISMPGEEELKEKKTANYSDLLQGRTNSLALMNRPQNDLHWASDPELLSSPSTPFTVDSFFEGIGGFKISGEHLESTFILSSDRSDRIRLVIQVVDACRIASHAGRFELIASLDTLMTSTMRQMTTNRKKKGENVFSQMDTKVCSDLWKFSKRLTDLLFLDGGNERRLFGRTVSRLSILSTMFLCQTSLSFFSCFLRESVRGDGHEFQHSWKTCTSCISNLFELGFGSMERPRIESTLFVQRLQSDCDELLSLARKKEETRRTLAFDMSLNSCLASLEHRAQSSLSTFTDTVLRPAWGVLRGFLRNSEENSVGLHFTHACVSIGMLLLDALHSWLTPDYGLDHTLSANAFATLSEMASLLSEILKDLSRFGSSLPLADTILSPLQAACVSIYVLLRQYSSAQKRLEAFLGSKSTFPVMSGRLSSILWSQLFILRSCLPCYPSGRVSNENIKRRTKAYGIHLYHVASLCDWNLVTTEQVGGKRAKASRRKLRAVLDSYAEKSNDLHQVSLTDQRFLHRSGAQANDPAFSQIPTVPRILMVIGERLSSLSLSNCKLSRLPESFGKYYSNLEVLNLRGNELSKLPDTLIRMKSLRSLDIGANNLTELPGGIGGLSRLTTLIADDNELGGLRASVRLCKDLTVLNLSKNFLHSTDFSGLALDLPKLHTFEYTPQKNKK